MYSETTPSILRPHCPRDDWQVRSLLWFLPTLYPNAHKWLSRRLADVRDQRAMCSVAVIDSRIVGLTIVTPKGSRVAKLSTIYVDPAFRYRGVGRLLLRSCCRDWLVDGMESAYVTADSSACNQLWPLLEHFGFHLAGSAANRYGEGRNELIYQWTPQGTGSTLHA
jgi:ribosomal protein S18 acetylase RimI-like enzyme